MFPRIPQGTPPPPYYTAPGPLDETQPGEEDSQQPEGRLGRDSSNELRGRSPSLSELEIEHFSVFSVFAYIFHTLHLWQVTV